jgi:hypothetical protein
MSENTQWTKMPMDRVVWSGHGLDVVVTVASDGHGGSVGVCPEGSLSAIRSCWGESGARWWFDIPGGRFPWHRSLERTVWKAIAWAQKYAMKQLTAKQQAEQQLEKIKDMLEIG